MRWLAVLVSAVIGAIIAGLLMYAFDHFGFYLIIVMPLLGGLLVGVMTYLPVIRQDAPTLPLAVIAVVAALGALAIYWIGSYLDYQNTLVETIQAEIPDTTREESLQLIDLFMEEEYGATGFRGFLADYATAGISINRITGSSDIALTGPLAYGFWGLEALVLLGMAVIIVIRRKQSALMKRLNPPADAV